ncbi:hypothetical protein AVEN_67192-1 [Araneus ventricosus]|uniref:Tc1-like transposase DDE domain-containing protein n=1 Tax=Araneus ventricosus TaxID=182803 RepID=A0A4Y2DMV6_ARAVE|nr:hypothetical protein AVEN_241073-1 [Araneus ventricosus]GBM17041.1 hypothetical protein AVEN_67192-1 [Araneus ventricosus]
MLQLYAIPQFPEGVIFQQDGAPPHYGNIVPEFLDTTFPQRWIGRGAVMAWPPPSPDITPLNFYLWGYAKQHVYSERINDINHLKQRITDVIHSVTPGVLTRVWEELDYRLDVCRATNGPTSNSAEQECKPGEFSFYLVKMSPIYLVSLLSCDRPKVHHDFTDTLYYKIAVKCKNRK